MNACIICGDPRQTLRQRRCPACYAYVRRNGRDRPEDLVIRYVEKLIEEELVSANQLVM